MLEYITSLVLMIDPITITFLEGMLLSMALGYLMGAERELRGKDAGISTHIFVLGGAMIFTMLSNIVDPASTSRIAAQIVTGIGFLCAGLILKEGSNVRNLTTAASLWFAAAIGMTIGYGYYAIAIIAGLASIFIPRIRHMKTEAYERQLEEEKRERRVRAKK